MRAPGNFTQGVVNGVVGGLWYILISELDGPGWAWLTTMFLGLLALGFMMAVIWIAWERRS